MKKTNSEATGAGNLPPLKGMTPLGWRDRCDAACAKAKADAALFPAFEMPFNLAGELLDESMNEENRTEYEARCKAENEKYQGKFNL